jgi:uncharacterized membrane protein
MPMMIKDIFRVNDWKITEFLAVIFSVQFGLLGLVLLEASGFAVPLARPAVGFVYLTFVPGALLLRILRVRGRPGIESVLYMAGLSLAFDMLAGFLLNTLGPCIGIDRPITPYYVTISLFIGVLLLAGLCCFRDREYHDPGAVIAVDEKTLAPLLFLALVPLVSVAGSYAVNAYGNNVLVYVSIFAVALIALMCGFNRFIPERLYPVAIVAAAASLLAQNAFLTDYLSYWDVHLEYNVASLVIAGGHWDATAPGYLNTMLSVVFLAPFYTQVCGMELTWTFKVAFQLLFCLVPLGLYVVYRRQAGGRIACLACLFFMFLVTFFTEMQGLTRQEVAELFLILILMLMTGAAPGGRTKSALTAVFGIGMVLSHYGLSYIYLIVFASAFVLFLLVTSAGNLLDSRKGRGLYRRPWLPAEGPLTLTFIGLFTGFLFVWYAGTSQSSALSSIWYLVCRMLDGIANELLNPEHVQGLSYLMQGASSPLYDLKKYLHLAMQGLILAGFLLVVAQGVRGFLKKKYNFSPEYVIFSFINLLICGAAMALPYFASSLNTSRMYQITLIILSPLAIIGGLGLIGTITSPLKRLNLHFRQEHAMGAMAILLVVYLFFNVGLAFNLANDHPMSLSLSEGRIDSYSLNDRAGLYDPLNTFGQDYYAAGWLADYKLTGKLVFSDYIAHYPVSSYGNTSFADERYLNANASNVKKDSYVYLGYPNLRGGVFKEASGSRAIFSTGEVMPGLEGKNKIYTSEGSAIYYAQ